MPEFQVKAHESGAEKDMILESDPDIWMLTGDKALQFTGNWFKFRPMAGIYIALFNYLAQDLNSDHS